jgi:hypothetical protein
MKITAVKTVIGKDGTHTVFTVEDDLPSHPTLQDMQCQLEVMGFYNDRTLIQKILRLFTGHWKSNV